MKKDVQKDVDSDNEEEAEKPKGILMKHDEYNTTKSVTFDEDANVVKEFLKT